MKYVNTNDIENRIQQTRKAEKVLQRGFDNERKKISISISINADLNNELNTYCKQNCVNKSLFIENAIREYIGKNTFLSNKPLISGNV